MYKINSFNNVGFLETKLPTKAIKLLNKYIKNKKEKVNYELAGNIKSSYSLEDKDNIFFNEYLNPLIDLYLKPYKNGAVVPTVLTKACKFKLNKFWVNFQKKHEFNPLHNHSGVLSFVIWMQIPSDFEKEKQIDFIKHSNSPEVNSFQFVYVNALGAVATHEYRLNKQYEKTLLLFPSTLRHQVYPFYLSDKERISISGNIALDSTQVVQ